MVQQRKNRLVVAKRDHTHITGRKVEESFSNDENSIRRPLLTTGGTYICKLEISWSAGSFSREKGSINTVPERHGIYLDDWEYVCNLLIGTLCKPQRRWQQVQGKTKDLIYRTIAQHVRFKTLYISYPSHAKQQREIPSICVVCETKPRQQIILTSIRSSTFLLCTMLKLRCGAVWDGKQMQPFFKF